MKTSFITTVLNEEKTITSLLDSILNQSKKPDEIIIVDAGSKDKTCELINSHPINKKIKLKLSKSPCLNRSQGRNLGIKSAAHSVLAISDAGCILDKDWLKIITKPLSSKPVDVTAGFYKVKTQSVFQKALAPFVAVMPDKLNPKTYLPSSRSLALKKSAWKKSAGYPENLSYCEDLIFAKNLKEQTNMIVKPDAIVYWNLPEHLSAYFNQIQNYAFGDIQARYKPHIFKIVSLFVRYLIFISLPPLFFIYLLWPIFNHFHYVNHLFGLIYLPFLQIITDLAIFSGVFKAFLLKKV